MLSTDRQITLSEMRVGLLMLGAIVILVALILNANGNFNFFSRKITLKARFTSADGLHQGSEVRLAGVPVGEVEKIRFLAPGEAADGRRVEAVFAISGTVDGKPASESIRTDSRAELDSTGLLGDDKRINLTLGDGDSPIAKNGAELASSSAKSFADLAGSGDDLMKRLNAVSDEVTEIAKKINAGDGTLGQFVNDPSFYQNLNRTMLETQGIISQIKKGDGTAGKLINDPELYRNANEVTAQLNQIIADLKLGKGTAGKLLRDEEFYNRAGRVLAKFETTTGDLNQIIADVRAGKGSAGKLLTDDALYNETRQTMTDARTAINNFNTSTSYINSILGKAQNGEGTVGKLLTDPSLYDNINNLSTESNKMIGDFRQNPKKYLTVQLKLF